MGKAPRKQGDPAKLLVPPPLARWGDSPTAQEWTSGREEIYRELQEQVYAQAALEAVRCGHYTARLAAVRGYEPLPTPPDPVQAFRKRLDDADELAEITTAGEQVACELRYYLAFLKNLQRQVRAGKSCATPVRNLKMLPHSTIARAALDMLDDARAFGYPPGRQLTRLLAELLEADRQDQTASRAPNARYAAAWFLAQDGTLTSRELARRIQGHPTTVARWRRSPEFLSEVDRARQDIEAFRAKGRWPKA